jgi:hypothetical protein
MKFTRAALALAGATALVVSGMAAPALADTDVPIYGGTTTITTTAKALPKITGAGIVMWGTDGATSAYVTKKGEARQQFTFDIVTPSNLKLEDDPITNEEGSVTGGRVTHKGAITFLNTKNGKKVAVGDFIINFKKGKVFATSVNGDAVDPLAVFKLDVIDPPLYPVYDDELLPTTAKIAGVNLLMTAKGADTLNELLKTGVFAKDLKFGKAVAKADLVEPV